MNDQKWIVRSDQRLYNLVSLLKPITIYITKLNAGLARRQRADLLYQVQIP